MPCKRAKQSSRRAETNKKSKTTTSSTTYHDEEADKDSLLSHLDFQREFQKLKSREGIFDYMDPLFQVSSLETLRMNLRFDEDAKRFLRLKLSRDDIQAVKNVHEHPSDSNTKKPLRISRAFNMISSSNVSSINEALQYYCHLHKLQQMIEGIGDKGVKREFARFHRCFVRAFDVQTGST